MAPEKTKAGGQGHSQTHGGSKEQPLVELQRACQQAYLNWVNELQQASIKNQARQQEAYVNCVRSLQEQSSSVTDVKQLGDVYRRSAKEFQQTLSGEDFKNEFTEAYRNYFRAIQSAWSRLDPNGLQF